MLATVYICKTVVYKMHLTNNCPPVYGDNPRDLENGLSCVRVDKHGITILYTYINVDLAHQEIVRATFCKGVKQYRS